MSASDLFYRNTHLTALCLLVILASGIGALLSLPRQEDPAAARRAGTIATFHPGATALRVESLVTEPIERRLQEIHEIDEITSLSRNGVSLLTVELAPEYGESDVNAIWSRVRDRITAAAVELPAGATPPRLEERASTAVTLLAAIVWEGEGPASPGLLSRIAAQLETRLRNLPDTRETALYGEAEEEVRVTVDPLRVAALGLGAGDVARALARADVKLPAGAIRGGANDVTLEVDGELTSLARVRAVPVRQRREGATVRVGDLAEVERTVREPAASEAWVDGRRSVVVAATAESAQRVDRWAARARSEVEDFRSRLSGDVEVRVLFDQGRYVEERLAHLATNLVLSACVASAVLFLLLGLRPAIVVAGMLPMTLALTLAQMQILGVPLHQTAIAGLIVAIGMLVDNAIIMVDAVAARLREGAPPAEAVSSGVRELALPLATATGTTLLAFLPIVLMPGGVGEFVGPVGLSVILSIFNSLLLSLTLTPSLAVRLARPGHSPTHRWREHGWSSPRLTAPFRWSLEQALRRPWLGATLPALLPALGFVVGTTLPVQFFPPNDRNQFQVQLVLPSHASIAETRKAALRAHELLAAHAEVQESHWFLGQTPPRVFYNMFGNQDGVPSYAGAFVTTRSAAATRALLPGLQRELIDAFPEARVLALPFEQGPKIEAPIEARIVGPDLEQLRRLGEQMRRILAETTGVTFTTAKLGGGEPKLQLAADEEAALLRGLRLADIAGQLQERTEGVVGGSVLEAGEEMPIRVRVSSADRASLERLGSGRLLGSPMRPAASGPGLPGMPVAALGEIALVPELASVARRNGERINTVQGYLEPYRMASTVLREFRQRLDESDLRLPTGFRLEFGGESARQRDALGRLAAHAAPLLLAMGGVVVLAFRSVSLAILIAVVAFLSIGLGQLGLWLLEHPLGFVAIVGIMGLIGVAINDSIVVLAGLCRDSRAAAGDRDGTIEVVVGASRHVIATSLTTMLGFLPLLSFGGRLWPPLAAVISVGVGGATLIALYLVPSIHLWMRRRGLRSADSIGRRGLTRVRRSRLLGFADVAPRRDC
jgi:multidrug efflux pump subunit AcrB